MRVEDSPHAAQRPCPVMVATSASVQPATRSPRDCRAAQVMSRYAHAAQPALHALPHDARNPSDVHGLPLAIGEDDRARACSRHRARL